jgi:hypothetical protein
MKEGKKMLQNRFPPFDESNMVIPMARRQVREWVEQEAKGAGLQRVVRDPEAYACWLAGSILSEYVIRGLVMRCMVSRWLQEAIANAQAPESPGQEGA